MKYETLKVGEILRNGDEYCRGNNLWRKIPNFMVGGSIANDLSEWRRLIKPDMGDNGAEKRRLFSIKKTV